MRARPIHITHIMPLIGTGGAQKQLYELIVNSDPAVATHEVLYYSDSPDDEAYKLYAAGGVKITRIPRNNKRPIKFVRTMAARIKQCNPDIVHCWLVSANFWGRLAAIWAGVKHIIVAWRNCDIWKPLGMKICEKLTINRVHHTANSFACANYIAEKIGIPSNRFTVIHNGIDPHKYDIDVERRQVFSGVSIPDGVKLITMVGRLEPQKNYPMLLRVAQKAKLIGLSVHFLIIGVGQMYYKLNEMARQLDVLDIVHFMGVRADIPQVLAASDIFLFTTNFEGFPNALLEAMAAGLPVITTNFAGADELVKDGINGRIVPVDDVQGAVKVLRDYLDDPDDARKIALAAQSFVRQEFSMQKMVKQTTALYRAILTGEYKAGESTGN